MERRTSRLLAVAVAWVVTMSLAQGVFAAAREDAVVGAAFVMTNAADQIRGNEIVMYRRQVDGTLNLHGYFPTGGIGSGPGIIEGVQGDPLGSQDPLILSENHRLLFAVNAGSNTISVFRVFGFGLLLVDEVDSGGKFPVSLAIRRNLLYVLNIGGDDANITGFHVGERGELTPLPRSTRSLNTGGGDPPNILETPAQVQFSPRGDMLVVTVKELGAAGRILVFSVDRSGLPSDVPVSTMGNGEVPFGFAFDANGHLLVSEAFGGTPFPGPPPPDLFAGGALSSYSIAPNGSLDFIDREPNFQGAPCWIAIAGRFAYITNTNSDSISGLKVKKDGGLSLLDANGVTASAIGFPTEVRVSPDNRFLYVILPKTGKVGMWEINNDGSLMSLGEVGGLEPNPAIAPSKYFTQEGGSAVGLAVTGVPSFFKPPRRE